MAKTTTSRKQRPVRRQPVKSRTAGKTKRAAKPVRQNAKRPANVAATIKALEQRIQKEKKQLVALRKKLPLQPVQDYVFKAHDGSEIRLSQMFGSKSDLILVHNMGRGCRYCTLWADGFTGFTKHLENRAGFVVISKNPVEVQREFYAGRGWNFKMYSSAETTFNRDMGYENEQGGQMPGVSAFYKDEAGQIFRTGTTWFGPGDDFCAVWPLLDLLKDGPNGWEPKYEY